MHIRFPPASSSATGAGRERPPAPGPLPRQSPADRPPSVPLLAEPPSRSPAGEGQPGLRHGKAQFVPGTFPAVLVRNQKIQQVSQNRRGKARGVGVDEHKEGPLRQRSGAEFHKAVQVFLQLPHLAAGPPAVAGRIHDNGVVPPPPADLPLHEFGAVVHNPAAPALAQATVAPPV